MSAAVVVLRGRPIAKAMIMTIRHTATSRLAALAVGPAPSTNASDVRRRAGLRLSHLAAAAGLGVLLGAAVPSAAAEPGWKAGCAYRMPSGIPGTGHGILADVCRSLNFCETMAAQGRPNLMAMGCFGYEAPSRRN